MLRLLPKLMLKHKVMPLMLRMPPNLHHVMDVLEPMVDIHQQSMLAQPTWDTAMKTTHSMHNKFADNNAHQLDTLQFQFVDNRQLDINLYVLMFALDLQWEL